MNAKKAIELLEENIQWYRDNGPPEEQTEIEEDPLKWLEAEPENVREWIEAQELAVLALKRMAES